MQTFKGRLVLKKEEIKEELNLAPRCLQLNIPLGEQKDLSGSNKWGKITQSDSFGIAVFDRKDEDVSNYGFIVSNKISPESTNRNRVKRALKAAVRYELGQLKAVWILFFWPNKKYLENRRRILFMK